jgi:hypothetical protein
MTRGSVRLRLTVLFAALFLASGAGLLGITYGLLSHANNGIITARIVSSGPLDSSGAAGQVPGALAFPLHSPSPPPPPPRHHPAASPVRNRLRSP